MESGSAGLKISGLPFLLSFLLFSGEISCFPPSDVLFFPPCGASFSVV